MPSAVDAARARRTARATQVKINEQWFINEIANRVDLTLTQRVKVACEFLKDKIVKNLNVPVKKEIIGGVTVVTERSKPGEFPRAETSTLLRSIFSDVPRPQGHKVVGYVGMPLDYGVKLELKMNRSFLLRTFRSLKPSLERMVSGPITGI